MILEIGVIGHSCQAHLYQGMSFVHNPEIRIGLSFFQAEMIQSNELTLPDAAWFPNDKKGSVQAFPLK